MKTINKFLFLALPLFALAVFSGCSKDKDGAPTNGTHKVVYKAIGSADTQLSVAVVGTDGHSNYETFSSLSGSSWTSKEYTMPASSAIIASAIINGTGPSSTSTLKVQVWVDGVMKVEGNSTGTVLSSQASYSFK